MFLKKYLLTLPHCLFIIIVIYSVNSCSKKEIGSNVPMFRGNLERTGLYKTKSLPILSEIMWKFKTTDDIRSSPIFYDGMVIFKSNDEYLYVVDIKGGQLKWQLKLTETIENLNIQPDENTNNENLNIQPDENTKNEKYKYRSRLFREDSPEESYIKSFESKPPSERKMSFAELLTPFSSTPCVIDDVIYCGSGDGNLIAIDIRTGGEKWRYKTGGAILSSPIIHTGIAYIGSSDNFIYAIDTHNGIEKWKFKTQGIIISSPTIFKNTIFCGSYDGYLYAVNINSGIEKWKFYTNSIISSPAIYNEMVFFGDMSGYFYAVNIDSGILVWKYYASRNITCSPAIINGIVYFGNSNATPVISNYENSGAIYDTTANFFALNAFNGKELWKFQTKGSVYSSPSIAENIIYFGCKTGYSGRIYALDITNGHEIWNLDIDSPIISSPLIVNGMLLFGCNDNYLYALK